MQQKTETQEVLEQVLAEDAARGFEPEVCDPVELGPLEENAVVGVVTEPLVFEEMTDLSSQLPTLPPPKLCGAKRGDSAPCTLEPYDGAQHSYAGTPFAAGLESASACGCNCCAACRGGVLKWIEQADARRGIDPNLSYTHEGDDSPYAPMRSPIAEGVSNGWVPVGEGLPELESGDVLISSGDAVLQGQLICKDPIRFDTCWGPIAAEAWQYLPQPFKPTP